MVECVERRFGSVGKLAEPIEWLSDNGSLCIAAETRALARQIGLVPWTTPVESPQSNGMAGDLPLRLSTTDNVRDWLSGRRELMRKSRFTDEQMVGIVREADRDAVGEVAKRRAISEQTIYTWRKRFGELRSEDVRRLRQLEAENARLEKLVAERDLEIEVMKALSAQHPRYGYRRIRIFLGRDGHPKSAGRAYRLWRLAKLQVPCKRGRKRVASSRPRPQAPAAAN
jgi:transposase InsO family protein